MARKTSNKGPGKRKPAKPRKAAAKKPARQKAAAPKAKKAVAPKPIVRPALRRPVKGRPSVARMPSPRPAPHKAPALSSSIYERDLVIKKVNTLLLPLMRKHDIDMWIVMDREYNPDPFAAGGLHDQRLIDQLVHHPLVEPDPLDHFRRQPLPGHPLVLLDEIGLGPPEALGRNLLAVDGAHDIGRATAAAISAISRPEVNDRGHNEGDHDDDEDELETLEIPAHAADH